MLYLHDIIEKKTRQNWGYVWAEDEGHARRLVRRDQEAAVHCRRSKHGLVARQVDPTDTRDDGDGFVVWF